MKKYLFLLLLTSCGYHSKDNELIGQVKKVHSNTPLVCGDYFSADISLGVMRNGVGSMSTQDVDVYIPREKDVETFKLAVESGQLVKITYDSKRITFCVPGYVVTKVEILK